MRAATAARISETARIGPTETYGLLGAITRRSASAIASTTPGAGDAVLRADDVDRVDLVCVAAGDEPLLEWEPPGRSQEIRPEGSVGRRENRDVEPDVTGKPLGDRRERLAGAHRLGANEMETQIEIAEQEPALAAPLLRRFERTPALTGSPPTAARCR